MRGVAAFKNIGVETKKEDRRVSELMARYKLLEAQLTELSKTSPSYFYQKQYKDMLNMLQATYRDFAPDEFFVDSRKNLDDFEIGLNKAEKRFQSFDKTIKKTGKSTSILNTKFGTFSILMSGIAASIFVWQNIQQLIGALFQPLVQVEKA